MLEKSKIKSNNIQVEIYQYGMSFKVIITQKLSKITRLISYTFYNPTQFIKINKTNSISFHDVEFQF